MDSKIIEKYIISIRDKDYESLENLYNMTHSAVFGFAFSILNNYHDAEDVMHDVYLNIFQYAELYRPKLTPMAWVFTITKNLAYLKIKKQKKVDTLLDNDLDNILKVYDNPDDKIFVEFILKSLSSIEKEIIILHDVTGLKYHEIAKVLNINLSTALSKYHRAIKKIRLKFKEDGYEKRGY